MNNNLIYIRYTRKSSEPKEKQALSIEEQIAECEKLENREGLKVAHKLEESRSAFKPNNRPEFDKMVSLIESGKANAILTWKPDRLCRNPKEGGNLLQFLQDGVLKEIRCSDGESFTPESDHLVLQIHFGMANQYSRNLSKNVKRGNSYRFHNKRQWLGPAKPGYLNYFDEVSKEKKIKTDDNRFSIIQKAMRLILSGSDTPMEALDKLNRQWGFRTRKTERQGGRPLSKSAWYRMLADPYYYGLMIRREGEEFGYHTQMVSEDEFQRLQFILGRKGRPHISKHDFPYKGPLKCGKCGGSVTAEERWHIVCTRCKTKFHKSKNRNECPECGLLIEEMKNPKMYHHIHYVCVKSKKGLCKQPSVNIKEIEKEIDNQLEKFEISEHLKDWAIQYLNELNNSETTDREKVRGNLEEAKNDCIKKLDSLVKLKISPQNTNGDVLSDEEYTGQRKLILSEKESLECELTRVDERMNRWHDLSVKTFNFACYARYWFAKGDVKTKTQILEALGSNLVINDRKLIIDGQKAFFLIEKGKQEILEEAKKFEPAKCLDIIANLGSCEPLRSAWLGD